MSGLEFNKISAAVLLAGIIAMTTGYVTKGLYKPELEPEKRGYQIAGAEDESAGDAGAVAKDAGPVNILAYMGAADAAAGEGLTKKCTACHDFGKGAAHKIGPALYGVVGRGVGSAGGYAYSDAMKSLGGNWDFQRLSEFLTSPKKYAAGTKMVFAGLGKPEDRANLIAYLRNLSDSPVAIPAYTPPPAEEKAEEAPAAEAASADAAKAAEKK